MSPTTPRPTDELVRITLGKSCVLVLTWQEYKRGIARGKAEKRRAAIERRMAGHHHAR